NVPYGDITIDQSGYVSYKDEEGEIVTLDAPISVVQFPNAQGLESIGQNLLVVTTASGEPLSEVDEETTSISTIVQGYKEMSNVNIAEEMVNLIVAQRAYELNSKAITTSDDMLQIANNLKN
ncbi:MAG: flagellar hook-basal body complex protein, partial [Firmicutes bacterium]|nr:flagellar hook-basal body complex protein [Bacillota bacterium]